MSIDAASLAERLRAAADVAEHLSRQISAALDRVATRGDKLTPAEILFLDDLAATLASASGGRTLTPAAQDYLDGPPARTTASGRESIRRRAPADR